LADDAVDSVGSAEDTEREAVSGTGRIEAPDPRRECEGVAGEFCRDLGTGSEGRGVFGGPKDGLDGRGSVVAMLDVLFWVIRVAAGRTAAIRRGLYGFCRASTFVYYTTGQLHDCRSICG